MLTRRTAAGFLVFVVALYAGLFTGLVVRIAHADFDAADMQCIPLKKECSCDKKKDPKTGECVKGENKYMCDCKDKTSSGKTVYGKCVAYKDCSATKVEDENGQPKTPEQCTSETCKGTSPSDRDPEQVPPPETGKPPSVPPPPPSGEQTPKPQTPFPEDATENSPEPDPKPNTFTSPEQLPEWARPDSSRPDPMGPNTTGVSPFGGTGGTNELSPEGHSGEGTFDGKSESYLEQALNSYKSDSPGFTRGQLSETSQQTSMLENAINTYSALEAGVKEAWEQIGNAYSKFSDSITSLGDSLADNPAAPDRFSSDNLFKSAEVAAGETPAAKDSTQIRVGPDGKINPVDFYNAAVEKFANSSLNGVTPEWGKKFGIDGSPESWAKFATQLAAQESNMRVAEVDANGALQRFSTTPAGEQSFGPLQFNKGQYGLETWADVNDPGRNIDALINVAEAGKMEAYFGPVQRPNEVLQQSSWFDNNVAPYVGNTPAAQPTELASGPAPEAANPLTSANTPIEPWYSPNNLQTPLTTAPTYDSGNFGNYEPAAPVNTYDGNPWANGNAAVAPESSFTPSALEGTPIAFNSPFEWNPLDSPGLGSSVSEGLALDQSNQGLSDFISANDASSRPAITGEGGPFETDLGDTVGEQLASLNDRGTPPSNEMISGEGGPQSVESKIGEMVGPTGDLRSGEKITQDVADAARAESDSNPQGDGTPVEQPTRSLTRSVQSSAPQINDTGISEGAALDQHNEALESYVALKNDTGISDTAALDQSNQGLSDFLESQGDDRKLDALLDEYEKAKSDPTKVNNDWQFPETLASSETMAEKLSDYLLEAKITEMVGPPPELASGEDVTKQINDSIEKDITDATGGAKETPTAREIMDQFEARFTPQTIAVSGEGESHDVSSLTDADRSLLARDVSDTLNSLTPQWERLGFESKGELERFLDVAGSDVSPDTTKVSVDDNIPTPEQVQTDPQRAVELANEKKYTFADPQGLKYFIFADPLTQALASESMKAKIAEAVNDNAKTVTLTESDLNGFKWGDANKEQLSKMDRVLDGSGYERPETNTPTNERSAGYEDALLLQRLADERLAGASPAGQATDLASGPAGGGNPPEPIALSGEGWPYSTDGNLPERVALSGEVVPTVDPNVPQHLALTGEGWPYSTDGNLPERTALSGEGAPQYEPGPGGIGSDAARAPGPAETAATARATEMDELQYEIDAMKSDLGKLEADSPAYAELEKQIAAREVALEKAAANANDPELQNAEPIKNPPLPLARPQLAGILGIDPKGCGGVCEYGNSDKTDGGSNVASIQKALNAQGANLKVDGIYGPRTEAAVEAFQKANNIAVDGVVGPQTVAKMNEIAMQQLNSAPATQAQFGGNSVPFNQYNQQYGGTGAGPTAQSVANAYVQPQTAIPTQPLTQTSPVPFKNVTGNITSPVFETQQPFSAVSLSPLTPAMPATWSINTIPSPNVPSYMWALGNGSWVSWKRWK